MQADANVREPQTFYLHCSCHHCWMKSVFTYQGSKHYLNVSIIMPTERKEKKKVDKEIPNFFIWASQHSAYSWGNANKARHPWAIIVSQDADMYVLCTPMWEIQYSMFIVLFHRLCMCIHLQIYLCSACIYKATACSGVFLEERVCLGVDNSILPYSVMPSKQLGPSCGWGIIYVLPIRCTRIYNASGKYWQCFTCSTFYHVTVLFQNELNSCATSKLWWKEPIVK